MFEFIDASGERTPVRSTRTLERLLRDGVITGATLFREIEQTAYSPAASSTLLRRIAAEQGIALSASLAVTQEPNTGTSREPAPVQAAPPSDHGAPLGGIGVDGIASPAAGPPVLRSAASDRLAGGNPWRRSASVVPLPQTPREPAPVVESPARSAPGATGSPGLHRSVLRVFLVLLATQITAAILGQVVAALVGSGFGAVVGFALGWPALAYFAGRWLRSHISPPTRGAVVWASGALSVLCLAFDPVRVIFVVMAGSALWLGARPR
jgi:hypothetical protein